MPDIVAIDARARSDGNGDFRAIKDIIAQGITEGEEGAYDADADREAFLRRLIQIRGRLATRIEGMPDDDTLRAHLDKLSAPLIHTLLVSDPWDSASVGGEEVDLDLLLPPAPVVEPAR